MKEPLLTVIFSLSIAGSFFGSPPKILASEMTECQANCPTKICPAQRPVPQDCQNWCFNPTNGYCNYSTGYSNVSPYWKPTPEQTKQDLYGVTGGTAGTQQNATSGTSGADQGINLARWLGAVEGHITNISSDNIWGLPGSPSNGSAVGFFTNSIIAMATTRPASSIDYIAYEINNLHVPGSPVPAYAASGGLGFTSLAPVLKIWTLTRNLAYLVFAIIFIIIGVMIITRQKIDPKTVANIQNALPKIVFALILVTFSYAIAGFLVDLMYVFLALIVTIFGPLIQGGSSQITSLLGGSIFDFVWNNGKSGLWFTAQNVAEVIKTVTENMLKGVLGGLGPGSSIAGLITGGLAFLIISIAILVALFRTWLALIGAYINIILGIIVAPLQLMLDAVPGQNQFGNWLKNMLANLLAFPLVVFLLTLGAALTSIGSQAQAAGQKGFVPPLLGAGDLGAAQSLLGLGILLTIPKALDILKEILKTPPFKYGSAWGESLAGGVGVSQAGYRYATKDIQVAKEGYQKQLGSYYAGAGARPTPVGIRGNLGKWWPF